MARRSKQFGLAYAYPLIAASVVMVTSLVGYSMVSTMAAPTTAVVNQNTSSTALSGAANALSRLVGADTDSWPLPVAGTTVNGDGYDIPQSSGASMVDAWTVKMRYCPWDHGISTSSGRIAGDRYPAANAPLYAVISAGPDKVFATSCANLKAGTTNGDDLAVWRSLSDFKKDGVGNSSLLEGVDCESATAPTTDLNNVASNCGTSTSRLDLIDTVVLKEGHQTVVRKSGKMMAWQGGGWRQILSGAGNYPTPTGLVFTDLTNQTCGSTVTSAAVQINGIASGTPVTIQGGSYATSLDNVTFSAWSTGVSTISPGTWVKLRATTPPATDYAATSVILNVGGTERIWNASNGICQCSLPWGGTINNGQSTTAYASSSVPFGNTCSSETRTCSGTTLSGSYQYGSCSVQAGASCNLPWGGSIASGASTVAYAASSVAYGSSCSSETRYCTNGTLSGSYTNSSCTVQGPASCGLPWGGSIASGQSVTAYAASSVAYGSSCTSQTRSCSNGSLSGSYQYSSCSVQAAASCSLPWGGSISNGQSVTAYASTSVAYGSSCSSQSRTCSNGTLSGSYQYNSCSVQSPASCSLPWGGSIAHGGSATAYAASTVPYGSSCTSQTRTCNNGSLSGSYSYSSCSVQPAPSASCNLPWGGTIAHGSSVTAYQWPAHYSPETCIAQSRSCNNGSLSGSYTYSSCVVYTGRWSTPSTSGYYCSPSIVSGSGNEKISGTGCTKPATNTFSGWFYDPAICGYSKPYYIYLKDQVCQ